MRFVNTTMSLDKSFLEKGEWILLKYSKITITGGAEMYLSQAKHFECTNSFLKSNKLKIIILPPENDCIIENCDFGKANIIHHSYVDDF